MPHWKIPPDVLEPLLKHLTDESNFESIECEDDEEIPLARFKIVWQNICFWADAYIERQYGIELFHDGQAHTMIHGDSYAIVDYESTLDAEQFMVEKAKVEKDCSNKDVF